MAKTAARLLSVAAGLLLLAGCGDSTDPAPAGLSRSDVEAIVSEQLSQAPAEPQPEPALTPRDVEEAVAEAVASIAWPDPGLSRAEVEQVVSAAVEAAAESRPALTAQDIERAVRVALASVPSKSAPARYTQFFVDSAIERYSSTGLEATLAHYNDQDSIDGQWYVFIIDFNDIIIGHYDPDRLGLDMKDWVGTDVNGYHFGPEMMSATEDGKWVTYVYRNPESGDVGSGDFGELQLKNAWVMRHDGLLFGSGWYIDADEFTESLVSTAVEQFRLAGLEGAIAHFAGPDSELAGLADAIDYYNSVDSIDGQWLAFIADADGTIVAHPQPEAVGTSLEDILGAAASHATADGRWITAADLGPSAGGPESMRVWMVSHDKMTFGAGWYKD